MHITIEEKQKLEKKLLYRSCNRGSKETDILLGKFALYYLDKLSYKELLDYEKLLNENDIDILNWITGRDELPKALKGELTYKLINFKNSD